jgi:hypothetical protein
MMILGAYRGLYILGNADIYCTFMQGSEFDSDAGDSTRVCIVHPYINHI